MAKKDNEEVSDLSTYEFEFKIIGPTNKVVSVETIEGSGKTEGEAIAAARTKIDKTLKEDQSVQFTGKFKKI